MNLELLSRRGLQVTGVLQTVTALVAVFAPDFFGGLFHGRPLSTDPLVLRLHVMVWLFLFALGLAWAHAGWSPGLQRSVLLAAGLGKGVAVGVWLEMLAQHLGTPLLWGAISFDGALSALFCVTFVKTSGRS